MCVYLSNYFQPTQNEARGTGAAEELRQFTSKAQQ